MKYLLIICCSFWGANLFTQNHIPEQSEEDGHNPVFLNQDQLLKEIGYPSIALNAGIIGTVELKVSIDTSGNYVSHEIVEDPHPILTAAVEKHVNKVHFSPGNNKGKKIAFSVNIPFHFGAEKISLKESVNLLNKGKYLEAEYSFRKLIKSNRYYLSARSGLILSLLAQGEEKKAKKEYEKIKKMIANHLVWEERYNYKSVELYKDQSLEIIENLPDEEWAKDMVTLMLISTLRELVY